MSKAAILGDKTSTLSFKAIGIDAYVIEKESQIEEAWNKVIKGDYSVVFLTEALYPKLSSLVEEIREQFTPAVVIVPSGKETTQEGQKRIKKIVERAVGVDILAKR